MHLYIAIVHKCFTAVLGYGQGCRRSHRTRSKSAFCMYHRSAHPSRPTDTAVYTHSNRASGLIFSASLTNQRKAVRNRETSQVVLLFPWSPLHSLHAHLRNLDIVLSFWFEPLDRFYFSCYISWFTAATAQRMMIDHYFEIITDGWRWICFIGIRNLLLHKNDMRCTRNENQNNVITLVTCSQAL